MSLLAWLQKSAYASGVEIGRQIQRTQDLTEQHFALLEARKSAARQCILTINRLTERAEIVGAIEAAFGVGKWETEIGVRPKLMKEEGR